MASVARLNEGGASAAQRRSERRLSAASHFFLPFLHCLATHLSPFLHGLADF